MHKEIESKVKGMIRIHSCLSHSSVVRFLSGGKSRPALQEVPCALAALGRQKENEPLPARAIELYYCADVVVGGSTAGGAFEAAGVSSL
jgi:hypothetical protein